MSLIAVQMVKVFAVGRNGFFAKCQERTHGIMLIVDYISTHPSKSKIRLWNWYVG